jgi:large subunit ribosomal protein L9
MRIILHREVEKLGAPGDVVQVADGYARNYLIPRGLAVPASKGALRQSETLRGVHRRRLDRAMHEAREKAEQLTSSRIRIPARAGAEGRLFGSITASDVADELKRTVGVGIDRRQIHLPEPIRSTGIHEATIHLHPEVNARVTVEVVPEA